MSLDTIGLEDALRLLQLPRVVGAAEDGEEVVARNGRYGPYIQKGKESRSLESEEQLFTIDLPGALALLAQPRQRRGQRAAATKPLRELGTDPVSGKEIVLKEGRFGPYVTDDETNASLRKGDDPETVTLDRAVELLTERRAKGPAKRGGRRRKAS
jgi:DNA topoisomerase-1